jgi:hypothetical protein
MFEYIFRSNTTFAKDKFILGIVHLMEMHRNIEQERQIQIITKGDRKWESFRHCGPRNYTDVYSGTQVVAALPPVTFRWAVF